MYKKFDGTKNMDIENNKSTKLYKIENELVVHDTYRYKVSYTTKKC